MDALVAELVDLLASPDPEVRDELAFATLATWVHEKVVPDERLRPLGDEMARRLDAEQVRTRCFAPLVLDVIVAARGVCEPAWVAAFERWYPAENDLRGYDPTLGWLHAVAHGADLLGDLGLRDDVGARRMLDLAVARMLAPTDSVWRDGEDERLAYALGKLLTRADLPETDAVEWLAPVAAEFETGEPGPVPAPVTNTVHTLRALYLLADKGVRVGPDAVDAVTHAGAVRARLADVLHIATPWMW